MYKGEQKWAFRYALTSANGQRIEKVCYPKSKEQIEKNKAACVRAGYEFISCKKLYQYNTYRDQHNFELIYNVCYNQMTDMEDGEIPYDNDKYIELEARRDRAAFFRELPLPTAWLTWDEWNEAKEMAAAAREHRANACIENGRFDLVQYC